MYSLSYGLLWLKASRGGKRRWYHVKKSEVGIAVFVFWLQKDVIVIAFFLSDWIVSTDLQSARPYLMDLGSTNGTFINVSSIYAYILKW